MARIVIPTREQTYEELRQMDLSYIKSLRHGIRFLNGYERRNKYNPVPCFLSEIQALKYELRGRIWKYERDWGYLLKK